MNNKEDRNKKILAIVLAVAVLFLGIYKLFFEKEEVYEEKIDTETISIVKNNSRFFTVASCVSKYINYLSINDSENLLILLFLNKIGSIFKILFATTKQLNKEINY